MFNLSHFCNSETTKSQQHQKANNDADTRSNKFRAENIVLAWGKRRLSGTMKKEMFSMMFQSKSWTQPGIDMESIEN